jgi:hypothetical protein
MSRTSPPGFATRQSASAAAKIAEAIAAGCETYKA